MNEHEIRTTHIIQKLKINCKKTVVLLVLLNPDGGILDEF